MRLEIALLFLVGCGQATAPVVVAGQHLPSARPSLPATAPQPRPVVRCAYVLTAPWAVSGEVLESDAPDACQVSISPGHFWIGVTDRPGIDWAIIDFDQSAHSVGDSFTPEVATVGPGPVYTVFTGTLTWLADAPDWRVSFDLTGIVDGPNWNQQTPTAEHVRLVGEMHGHAVATE